MFVIMDIDKYYDEIARLWPHYRNSRRRRWNVCLAAVAEYPESSTLWYDLGIVMHAVGNEFGFTRDDYSHVLKNSVRSDRANAEAHQELGYALECFFDGYGTAERI